MPTSETTNLPSGKTPVLSFLKPRDYSAADGDYFQVRHRDALELKQGTIAFNFTADQLWGSMALVSKDRSGEGKGQFSVWIKDGTLVIYLENNDGYEYIKVPQLVLAVDTTYQFALSFGSRGLEVWLNGEMVAAEPLERTGIDANSQHLLFGATRSWRDTKNGEPHSSFDGTIAGIQIYDKQLGQGDMVALAADASPDLGAAARMAHAMADLMPAFDQMHHASDLLEGIAAEYGISAHGHMMTPLNMISGASGNDTLAGTDGADGIDGRKGNDTIDGLAGKDVLQGHYGNDRLMGGDGNDILDGGHGEDILMGGAGNDLLISRSDAREPKIARIPGRDEGDPYKELTRGKLYPDQPINGDDAMTGGDGADIFYFQTLINAKARFIKKHTNDDGTINWHGVAGENDNKHDHWVDMIGNDVVMDYDRSEGDRLVIEGHTTKIKSIVYRDQNKDGIMDKSVIQLYSDQGKNGGAHNKDLLGKIIVYGDLVNRSDIETTAAPAYGIVTASNDLREAIKPMEISKDRGPIKPTEALLTNPDLTNPGSAELLMGIPDGQRFDPELRNHMVFDHSSDMKVANGTISFSFMAQGEPSWGALFSKDAEGYGRGGNVAAFVEDDGDLVVRLQTRDASHYFAARGAIEKGTWYDVDFTFGKGGAALYLDGVKVAYDATLKQGLKTNGEDIVLGATGWGSTPGTSDSVGGTFNGRISDFALYKGKLSTADIRDGTSREGFVEFDGQARDFSFSKTSGKLVVTKGGEAQEIGAGTRFLEFDDMAVRPVDTHIGTGKADDISGSSASEILVGGGGKDSLKGYDHDDLLIGGGGDDWLHGGDGKDQLIGSTGDDYLDGGEGNDVLWGGAGNDELKGGRGNDKFYGGIGDDTMYGNAWGEGGYGKKDRAYFDGNFDDYDFELETFWNSTRDKQVNRLVVTDRADGGLDGYYEGRDALIDIDLFVFSDRTVAFDEFL